MIPDRIFKQLKHEYAGYNKYLNGQQLERGYKPDYVLRNKNDYIILESENNSSRKMYVGGMMKAAHFLQNKKTGILIFVIKFRDNTKPISIAKHLKRYFNWIYQNTNLREVYIIDMEDYYCDECVLSIDSADFQIKSHKVGNT
ncbi:hypothetical protein [Zunongwangia atlantica]|uniref:Uncharacterized protein n=1 Tax=Zunongwangia atlantica 22II14-10F7 TaxID=1185767 RepID=A0A1Y1T5N0_9FLAO|nr:hypothetical protein [Zunongwangia atlantica]ORL46346.1 hypothetical protein IIF7_07241 [Zunongwangia atlantica 22II14-10F7]